MCVAAAPLKRMIEKNPVYCGPPNRATRTAQMTYISQSLNTQTEKGQENHALFENKKREREEKKSCKQSFAVCLLWSPRMLSVCLCNFQKLTVEKRVAKANCPAVT